MWNILPPEGKKIYYERQKLDKDRYERDIMAEQIVSRGKKLIDNNQNVQGAQVPLGLEDPKLVINNQRSPEKKK